MHRNCGKPVARERAGRDRFIRVRQDWAGQQAYPFHMFSFDVELYTPLYRPYPRSTRSGLAGGPGGGDGRPTPAPAASGVGSDTLSVVAWGRALARPAAQMRRRDLARGAMVDRYRNKDESSNNTRSEGNDRRDGVDSRNEMTDWALPID